jgi:hypothetical protein
MIRTGVPRRVLAGVVGGVAVAGMSATASAIKPTPQPQAPACGYGYEGQSVTALVGRAQTFRFEVPGAVPAGHEIRSVRFTWGDGTRSSGRAITRSKPQPKGCYTTIFSARHTYKKVTCRAGICSSTYRITLRYRDAKTRAIKTNGKLRAIVLKPPPKK